MPERPLRIGDRVRLKRCDPKHGTYGWQIVGVPINGDALYTLAHERGEKTNAWLSEIELTSL